ncbi:MAG: hypothetical protein NC123_17280 [Butyrivibrio sp.]|nr:hypothetical protein [Butyrivibrio sp.]
MGKGQNRSQEETIEAFRRQSGREMIVIDAWNPGTSENKVPDEELLPGEIAAVTFRVGSYIVRSALRVYQVHGPDWYLSEPDAPAEREDAETVRKDLLWKQGKEKDIRAGGGIFAAWGDRDIYEGYTLAWRERLRITHEISAKHDSSPDGTFTYICRAADPMNGRWFEYIGDIYAVKEKEDIPDGCASLLVYSVFTSDFNGIDIWYRFEPDGKVYKSNG